MLVKQLDLAFSKNGDYVLEDGDLKDTSWDPWESFKQEVRTRLCSIKGDWKLHPQLGADLITELGMPNTQETGERIKTKATLALLAHGFVSKEDFSLRVFPLFLETIGIFVKAVGFDPKEGAVEIQELFVETNTEINPGLISAN